MTKAGFLDFDLFAYPSTVKPRTELKGAGKSHILVVVEAEAAAKVANLAFLESILQAAKLVPAADHIYRIDLAANVSFALATHCRELPLTDILMFGDFQKRLGLHAQLPLYTFTRLGEVHYLLAHDLEQLRTEREQGKKQHAGALWQALKTRYL